jgi:hypothetical protein
MKNVVFWHICGINNYKTVVEEQFNAIVSSKLIDEVDCIYITFLGKEKTEIQWLLDKHVKLVLQNFDTNLRHYERLCLMSLLAYAKDNEANILYIHAKGVSKPYNKHVQSWRRMLEYFLIEKHKKCLELLSEYDVLGSLLARNGNQERITNEKHKFHFSGNFWWSKTSYIRKLPSLHQPHLVDLHKNSKYWLCETWILHPHPNVKLLEIYKEKSSHFYTHSPDLKYLNHTF